jgi:hypothetical protein
MSNIDALARDWLDTKRAENEAAARRLKIEEQLAAALDVKDEGSITHKLEAHKVTLTQPVSRKLDEAVWATVKGEVQPDLWPVKTKTEADASGIKWLEKNDPATWRKLAPAFTSKKGKINVKVEAI